MSAHTEAAAAPDAAGEKLFQSGITISPQARAWVREFLSKNYSVSFDATK